MLNSAIVGSVILVICPCRVLLRINLTWNIPPSIPSDVRPSAVNEDGKVVTVPERRLARCATPGVVWNDSVESTLNDA